MAEAWLSKAACRGKDPDIFFGNSRKNEDSWYLYAKSICMTCGVRRTCLEDALSIPIAQQDGVQGGMNPQERIKIIKHRNKVKQYA